MVTHSIFCMLKESLILRDVQIHGNSCKEKMMQQLVLHFGERVTECVVA